MSSPFTGKRIVVTGGAGGIGIETVRGFVDQGGHVIVADIDEAALERAQAVLGRVRLGTIVSALDTPGECARVIEAAGGGRFMRWCTWRGCSSGMNSILRSTACGTARLPRT